MSHVPSFVQSHRYWSVAFGTSLEDEDPSNVTVVFPLGHVGEVTNRAVGRPGKNSFMGTAAVSFAVRGVRFQFASIVRRAE